MIQVTEMKRDSPLGESEAFFDFQQDLSRAAKVDRSVLVIGERGSGKELAASRLHYLSPRWQKPFVAINCAALPQSLIETELFGHEAGAYTGAVKTRKGRFEEADSGTLFLDEIGLIPLEVQEKILRVVEYGSFERVGSSRTIEVDVRIVGATNADLPALCKSGRFKQDLLDRLSFEVLFIPPLRERGDDIILLANYFAAKMAYECDMDDVPAFSDQVVDQMLTYRWPGNIRELKNTVERAVYRTDGHPFIEELVVDPFRNPYADQLQEDPEDPYSLYDLDRYRQARESLDVAFLKKALFRAGQNQKQAAQLLGLSYDQFRGLYRKLKDQLL
ncbi:MAG: sigma 54-interacting transcriptional regulator [Spirochaetia bacterium]|nr:sigma 54-interacting transcriptional regulator [Spirochaetia bacterium]